MRLEGIGFGFLIPIYFVVTGMTFDLDSFLTRERPALAAMFLGAAARRARGVGVPLAARARLPRERRPSLSSARPGLPLIVAIVDIGMDRGAIADDVGASLIGAGMISVLVFPLVGIAVAGRGRAGRRGDRGRGRRGRRPSTEFRQRAAVQASLESS